MDVSEKKADFGKRWKAIEEINLDPTDDKKVISVLTDYYAKGASNEAHIKHLAERIESDLSQRTFERALRRDFLALGIELGFFPEINEHTFDDMSIPEGIDDEEKYRENVKKIAFRLVIDESMETIAAWELAQKMNTTAFEKKQDPSDEKVIQQLLEAYIPDQDIHKQRAETHSQIGLTLNTMN